jgi:phosphoribulokinase
MPEFTLTELSRRYQRAAMRLALDGIRDDERDFRAYVASVHGDTETLSRLISETGKSGKKFKSKEESKKAKAAYARLFDHERFQEAAKKVDVQ